MPYLLLWLQQDHCSIKASEGSDFVGRADVIRHIYNP